jgi:ribosomal protein L29
MAILRVREISKMDSKTRKEKLGDLRMELVKANVTANKQNAKTKEIKRAISRILTSEKTNKVTEADEAEVKKR